MFCLEGPCPIYYVNIICSSTYKSLTIVLHKAFSYSFIISTTRAYMPTLGFSRVV